MPYAGKRSIRALLEGMHDLLGWEPIMEGDNIIGMFDVTGGGAISLEPGGQFELSGAPLDNVHQTAAELMAHLAQVREVAKPLGIGFLGLGMTPNWTRADMPKMPKGRYKIMTAYMPKVGTLGLDMMYRTCTVQANLDFSSRSRHGEEAARVAGAAAGGDRAVRQFAVHRRQAERLSCRSAREIWRDTDNQRAGMLPWAFEDGMGFERYVDYALDVPMYFVKRGDKYIDVAGKSFRDFFAGKLAELPGERPTISDWANHLSTIFPEVRLKRYLEMRGADGGPWRRLPSLTAYWVGLLYDDDALDACWDMVKGWTARGAAEAARRCAEARLQGGNRQPQRASRWRRRRCGSARAGSRAASGSTATAATRRAICGRWKKSIARGITPAEELLEKFHGEWDGSVEPIFEEYAY